MENSKKLFALALHLQSPWYIKDVKFKAIGKSHGQLDIYLDFQKGAKFQDETGADCPVHDTKTRTWQHLDFFQHTCYLHARVPRIKTSEGLVRLVEVPWARPNSGFTLLFEAFAMTLIESEMPVSNAAKILKIWAPRLWRIFKYWIGQARSKVVLAGLNKIGVDETSVTRGHKYVTLSADIDERRVIYASAGHDENNIKHLRNYLKTKDINPKDISHFSIDMSRAFIAGITKEFPDSGIVFDRFHLKKKLNESMDKLRKLERREHELLKGHKYTFLKNQKNLTQKQKRTKFELMELFPKLGEAVRFVELFDDFYSFRDKEQAAAYLAWWCDLVEESGIFPFQKFVRTVKTHWSGIINWYDDKISNGILEGINSKVQLAKKRARGYQNVENFISMIYFIAGDLEFDYPHKTL
jgi:transposase